jgi:hypothetical protein
MNNTIKYTTVQIIYSGSHSTIAIKIQLLSHAMCQLKDDRK